MLQALPFGRKSHKAVETTEYPQDLLSRLSSIPVYAVANRQNEFILVASEVSLRHCIEWRSCNHADTCM